MNPFQELSVDYKLRTIIAIIVSPFPTMCFLKIFFENDSYTLEEFFLQDTLSQRPVCSNPLICQTLCPIHPIRGSMKIETQSMHA